MKRHSPNRRRASVALALAAASLCACGETETIADLGATPNSALGPLYTFDVIATSVPEPVRAVRLTAAGPIDRSELNGSVRLRGNWADPVCQPVDPDAVVVSGVDDVYPETAEISLASIDPLQTGDPVLRCAFHAQSPEDMAQLAVWATEASDGRISNQAALPEFSVADIAVAASVSEWLPTANRPDFGRLYEVTATLVAAEGTLSSLQFELAAPRRNAAPRERTTFIDCDRTVPSSLYEYFLGLETAHLGVVSTTRGIVPGDLVARCRVRSAADLGAEDFVILRRDASLLDPSRDRRWAYDHRALVQVTGVVAMD